MKTITLPTNLNEKIGCSSIIHIMPPAKNKITAEVMDEPVQFACGEIKTTYFLDDYVSQPMKDVPPHIFHQSHGLRTRQEFHDYMYKTHGLHPTDKVGVYFFWRDGA